MAAMNVPNLNGLITSLNDNDVLLGRGIGPSYFIGNKRMAELVESRKTQYNSIRSYKEKAKLAADIVLIIRLRGGRFVRQVTAESWPCTVCWRIIEDDKVAQEKIKQALREKPASPEGSAKRRRENEESEGGLKRDRQEGEDEVPLNVISGADAVSMLEQSDVSSLLVSPQAVLSDGATIDEAAAGQVSEGPTIPTQPSPLGSCVGAQAVMDSRLLLYQTTFQHQQQMAMNVALQSQLERAVQHRKMVDDVLRSQLQEALNLNVASALENPRVPREASMEHGTPSTSYATTTMTHHVPSSSEYLDGDITELMLSTLGYSEDTIFTEQDEENERRAMTEEEKTAALSDMFGQLCLTSVPQIKKSRKDFDRATVLFLLSQMRKEIETIPLNEKQALMQAQLKCHDEEFRNERLEQFLRFEGMNPKLAAERFVRYWEARRDVFGEEKYTLRMTLSGALRDDMEAFMAGVYCLLPHLDLSGRRLLYVAPWRHTRDGYDTDNLIRVIWYLMELVAQESQETGNGFSCIVWDKYTTIWDIDRKLNERVTYFYRRCWPVRAMATHICCPPRIMVFFLKPAFLALMSKEDRSRLIFHDAPESEIFESLSGYGIVKDMLPTEMLGRVELDQIEWIAMRRAMEVEEL